MLNFIFAESGCGKTEYVFSKIKELAHDGSRNILLITPEQFSFAAERRFLTDLGERGITAVENSSFSRLYDSVCRARDGERLPVLSKGAKAVLMMRAVEASRPKLRLFGRRLDSSDFVESMVSIYDEMKSCNLSADEIYEKAQGIDGVSLKRKMSDIAVIIKEYELLLRDKYIDCADELTRLYNYLNGMEYFKGRYVFIDGFNGFVAQEYKILELIISEARCTTVTLCTDNEKSDDKFSLFGYVNNTARIIGKIADKANISKKSIYLAENHRANNDDIKLMASKIFRSNSPSGMDAKNISIYSASGITDECNNAALEIRRLLRQGFRAREIAVIVRDLSKYRAELTAAFQKYDIPFYADERQPVKNQPLIVFIEYLLRCVNFLFRSDDILSLAKTGLTPLSDDEINRLENYIFLWNISGMKWTKPFENSTKGFVNEITDSDKKLLEKINNSRKILISIIADFKNNIKGGDAAVICEQIYRTLIKARANEKLRQNAVRLADMNMTSAAAEQGRIWDLTMEMLDILPKVMGDGAVSLRDFAKIFSLVISAEDMGMLPAGIDNIQFGQADRIRTESPRAAFVLGANEGEFPLTAGSSGLLSESDRRVLLKNKFKLYSYGEILNFQERYFAYMACCAPKERLFVSYTGNNGRNSSPSEIVTSINSIFNIREKTIADIDDIDLIETKRNAFELMSERYFVNTPFYASLREYFKDDPQFATIRDLAENKEVLIKNKDLAQALFSYDMYVSASRVEDYYNCAFRYFCKFGLKAKPRKKAEIDPMQRGTLIHYVLEMILSQTGSRALAEMSEGEIIALVDRYTLEYLESEMSAGEQSHRFRYNYKRLSKLIYSVVIHLAREFADCDFEPRAFELGIDRDGSVKPEIIKLSDGGTVQIRGSIDRVDIYEKDGKRYVRVVDYKSGNKSFSLSDIMHGLNLQMFIYLFALCEDKNAELSGVPAGVLYMHAARNIFSFDSKKSALQETDEEENASFKMKGIVLDDDSGEIARAMEHEIAGRYIPVKQKKNGELTGKLAKLQELGYIHKKINSLLADMGMQLHRGNIQRNPVLDKNHMHTCEYCDYRDVCANQRLIEYRLPEAFTDESVKEQLEREYGRDSKVD